MSLRGGPQQQAHFSHNASDLKDRKALHDQDDIESRTTVPSDSGSDQDRDRRLSGNSPPSSLPKTSLKSLKSQAKLFVPTEELGSADLAMMLPTCTPTPGKDCLAGIIQSTLGDEVWNLNMMDGMSYDGQWYTAVEITIPELSASMCHLAINGDAEAIKVSQQRNFHSLIQALRDFKPSMVLQPAEHGAQICVEFCAAADRAKLCREFSHCGSCPRGATCRWEHAVLELFMINFVLAPLAHWESNTETPGPQSSQGDEQARTGRWLPSRPPMPPPPETVGGLPSANSTTDMQRSSLEDSKSNAQSFGVHDTDAGKNDSVKDACKCEAIKVLAPDKRPKNPRLVSKKKWSDIQDESDDDVVCYAFGQTL